MLKINRMTVMNIGKHLILVALFAGATIFLFDDQPQNDRGGWLLLIAFWMVRSLYGLIQHIKEQDKKFAIIELLFVVVTAGVLCWQGVITIT